MAIRRAAIAIGVRDTQGFPALPGAVAGADAFVAWATAAKCDVVTLLSDGAPNAKVRLSDICDAIDAVVARRDIEQLFIYFAGHGMALGTEEDFWLLSAGVRRPSEVVALRKSLAVARNCRIPHVVVFSDACRTIPAANSVDAALSGTSIFSPGTPGQPAEIDAFYASLPTTASQEVAGQGIFSGVLMTALGGKANLGQADPASGSKDICAAHLDRFLREEVPLAADAAGANAQEPWATTESEFPRFLVEVSAPKSYTLTVEVAFPADIPAAAAKHVEVEILAVDRETMDVGAAVKKGKGVPFSVKLPRFGLYGVSAFLPGTEQDPPSPEPFKLLRGDAVARVSLRQRLAHAGSGGGFGIADGGDPTEVLPAPMAPELGEPVSPPAPARLILTARVVDEQGRSHASAPADGLFTVITEDLASGRVVSEERLMVAGEAPTPAVTLLPDAASAARLERVTAFTWRDHYETATGLTVGGARVYQAYLRGGHIGLFKEGGAWNVRYQTELSSAVLALGSKRYAALAVFPGFIGEVLAGPGGVENLCYTPGPNGPFDRGAIAQPGAREARREVLALLQAAARRGHFAPAVDLAMAEAEAMNSDPLDPIASVLAAHALAEAGDAPRLGTLMSAFANRAQPMPFDVAFLAVGAGWVTLPHVAPSFPMLTATWARLGDDATLHPAVARARKRLAPALWATVLGRAGRTLGKAIQEGTLR